MLQTVFAAGKARGLPNKFNAAEIVYYCKGGIDVRLFSVARARWRS